MGGVVETHPARVVGRPCSSVGMKAFPSKSDVPMSLPPASRPRHNAGITTPGLDPIAGKEPPSMSVKYRVVSIDGAVGTSRGDVIWVVWLRTSFQ
jgi:hypothetical protein